MIQWVCGRNPGETLDEAAGHSFYVCSCTKSSAQEALEEGTCRKMIVEMQKLIRLQTGLTWGGRGRGVHHWWTSSRQWWWEVPGEGKESCREKGGKAQEGRYRYVQCTCSRVKPYRKPHTNCAVVYCCKQNHRWTTCCLDVSCQWHCCKLWTPGL